MFRKLFAVALLVAFGLISAPQAQAQVGGTTTTQPEMSCFVNSATLAEYTACHFIGEGTPTAVIETLAGTYTVVCTYAGGCSFTYVAHSPFRPRTQEP